MKTSEDVITITIEAGNTTAKVNQTLEPGRIVKVVCFNNAAVNPGTVRAAIFDKSGNAVSKMQDLRNYRSREAGYMDGAKPLPVNGGEAYSVQVIADQPFTDDFSADFIFIYEDNESPY